MLRCELAYIENLGDLSEEDYWQEDNKLPFGSGPNVRWCADIKFTIRVIDDTLGVFKKRKQSLGDEIYIFVCSPTFAKEPHQVFLNNRTKMITMDSFSIEETKNRISEQLSSIKGSSVSELFDQLKKVFDVEPL